MSAEIDPCFFETLITNGPECPRDLGRHKWAEFPSLIFNMDIEMGEQKPGKDLSEREIALFEQEVRDEKSIECANRHANVERIIKWVQSRDRKPANIEFTEGPERQMAYVIEDIINNLSRKHEIMEEMRARG